MAIPVTFSGQTFTIPSQAERNWASTLNAFFIGLAANALPRAGGSFTLAADLDLGSTANLYVKGLVSKTAGPAATGYVRLANNEALGWRNFAGTGDLLLKANASDQLEYNGSPLAFAASSQPLDADLTAIAALNTTGLAKRSAPDTWVLTTARSEIGLTTKGDVLADTGTALVRVPVGSNGTVLTADSSQPSGLAYTSPLTNPMNAVGDLIAGGTSGAATRLAPNTAAVRQVLTQTGTGSAGQTPAWSDDDASATQKGRVSGNAGYPGNNTGTTVPATKIGETIRFTYSGVAVSTASTNVGQVTSLTPGKYRLKTAGAMAKGSVTQLFISLSSGVGTIDTSVPGETFVDAPLNGPASTFVYNLDRTINVTATTTWYVNAQTASSSNTTSGIIEATRIA